MKMDKERRRHPRFPAAGHPKKEPAKVVIFKPINLFFWEIRTTIPGVLLDLSAGGMGLLTFVPVKKGCRLKLQLDLPALKTEIIEGRVAWIVGKGESWRLGIEFSKISRKDSEMINHVASDYSGCEMRILKNDKAVCVKNCHYALSCSKTQKKIFPHQK